MEIKTGEGTLTLETRDDGTINLSIETKNECTQAHVLCLGRIINLLLASGVEYGVIIRQLEDISSDQGVWADGQFVKSIPDAVAKLLSSVDGQAIAVAQD